MKKILLVLCFFIGVSIVSATEQNQLNTNMQPITVPQNVSYENCTKIYNIKQEKLFYLTIAALTANKFNIEEIQTSNGYVIFSVKDNRYIATIAEVDGTNSLLKITPCNNVYNFPPGIIINTFKYIDLNLNSVIE